MPYQYFLSIIIPDIAKELETVLPLSEPLEFGTAKDGEKVTAKERVSLNFYIGEYRFSDEFMIIENLSEPVIIGAKTLQAWRMKLDFENDDVIIDPEVTKLRLILSEESQYYVEIITPYPNFLLISRCLSL